ncbi:MAG: hypothetical protein JXR59_07920 [Desulfuromonadaceae bacterium]|nr:hypothetical protein [Desulfuromonadaceae bacterium]
MMSRYRYSEEGDPALFGPLPEGEVDLIRPLFHEVFGHEVSADLLHWKYGGGRGVSWVGRDQAGELLIHCGLFHRRALVGGRAQRVAQLVDLMASPRMHGGLSRKQSPFYLLIAPLLDTIATADNPGAWAFGFPSDRAMRLGEHLGVFTTIDRVYELSFCPPSGTDVRYRLVRLSHLSGRDGQKVQHVWQQMAADLGGGVVGVRDVEYLHQRYLKHPEKKYQLYLVLSPRLRRPLGAFVVHPEGNDAELMDIISPLRHVPKIVQAARQWLKATNGHQLKLWLASSHIDLLADQAVSITPLEFRIMANPFTPAEELQRFDQRWWLTSGDTDYR